MALQHDYTAVSLGKQRLRSETAALVGYIRLVEDNYLLVHETISTRIRNCPGYSIFGIDCPRPLHPFSLSHSCPFGHCSGRFLGGTPHYLFLKNKLKFKAGLAAVSTITLFLF